MLNAIKCHVHCQHYIHPTPQPFSHHQWWSITQHFQTSCTSHSANLQCFRAFSRWIFGTFAVLILCEVFLPYSIYIYANTHQHLHCQNPLFPKLCTFKLLTNTPRIAEKACYVEVTAVLHCGWMFLRSRGPVLHFQLEHFRQNCEKHSYCEIASFYCIIYNSLRR